MASRRVALRGIFERVTGLIKGGAMRPEAKPLWYDVYAAFPPASEPYEDREPDPTLPPLKELYYPEDAVRAEFYRQVILEKELEVRRYTPFEPISTLNYKSDCQHFVDDFYRIVEEQPSLSIQEAYERTLEKYHKKTRPDQRRSESSRSF